MCFAAVWQDHMDVGGGVGVLILAAELHIHACARKKTCIHIYTQRVAMWGCESRNKQVFMGLLGRENQSHV